MGRKSGPLLPARSLAIIICSLSFAVAAELFLVDLK